MPGASSVDVELVAKRVTVGGQGVDDDAVRRAIAQDGYEVVP